MGKTVLLTLGRLPKALELARAFDRAGWRVVIAEPFAWHVSRLSNAVARSVTVTAPGVDRRLYLDDLVRVASEHCADLIVPISEESMHVAGLHGRLRGGVTLFAPPHETLLRLHDKLSFIGVARRYGLDVPETFAATDPRAKALALEGAHVVKPVFSCSGKGVKIVTGAAALDEADRLPNTIVQQFIPGPVLSSFSIAHRGRALVSAVYRGTVMSGTVSVAFERMTNVPTVHAWIDKFVAAAGYSGFISFDFVEAGDGKIFAIECNPRMTSGAHFVHPDDFARAISEPDDPRPVRFKDETLFQQFYPCLTETQKSVFRAEERRNNLGYLLRSKDVVWQARDPLPFLLMPMSSYQILALSIFKGLSFGEAATRDIEWTPE